MEIQWVEINSKQYLKFIFSGYLEEDESLKAIVKLKNEIKLHANSKISIIWDCLLLEGYNPQARIQWQNTIKEFKNQIETIWFISSSLLQRTGVNIISRYTGLNINAITSENKIE